MPIPPAVPTVREGYWMDYPAPHSILPALTLFRFLCRNPDEAQDEGVYYRRVHRGSDDRTCLQLILYYRLQRFPYHPNDFAPIFIYFDPHGRVTRLVYDKSHHRAELKINPEMYTFTILAPWHAIQYGRRYWPSKPMRLSYHPLEEQLIRQWWFLPGRAQLKLRSRLVDPWHDGLIGPREDRRFTFRDEARCPVCGEGVEMDAMDLHGNCLQARRRCRQKHLLDVCYDPATQMIEAHLAP